MGSTSSSRSSSKLIHRVGVVAGLRPHKTNRVQQHVPCCAVRPSGLLLSEQKFQFRLRTSCEFRQRRQAIRSGCPLMESWGRSTGNTTHTRLGRWGRAPVRGGGGLFQTRSVFGSVSTRRPESLAALLAHRANQPSFAGKRQLPPTVGCFKRNVVRNAKRTMG